MHIADATGLEKKPWRIHPGPPELPDNREPPFPALRTVGALFDLSAANGILEDAVARMKLRGTEEDKDGQR